MWLVKNKIWAGDFKIFVNKPTRNSEGYWEDLSEPNNDRRYGYIIPPLEVATGLTWNDEPIEVSICLQSNSNSEDEEPIYMIATAEEGQSDWYGDYNYGYCPLSKYAHDSTKTEAKQLTGSSHGYGCPGYVVKTTMSYLKEMGWESDYEKYKTTQEVWDYKYRFY